MCTALSRDYIHKVSSYSLKKQIKQTEQNGEIHSEQIW